MKKYLTLLILALFTANLRAETAPRFLTQAELDRFYQTVKAVADADSPGTPHHLWTWYPEKSFRSEMELSNESLTIRFTDIGRNDQIISNLLLNPEFLKGTLNIQVFSGEMLSTGLASEIFQLSGSGATGLGENTSTVKFRKISPGETIQVTFNLLDAMKQVRNPKLAAYLAKKSIDFCLIFPISPDLLGSTDRGTIDFHSPDVVYNLR